jgi:hypothetical protein
LWGSARGVCASWSGTARHYLSAGPTGIDDISSFQRAGEAYFSTSGYGGAATIESSDACSFAVSNTQS